MEYASAPVETQPATGFTSERLMQKSDKCRGAAYAFPVHAAGSDYVTPTARALAAITARLDLAATLPQAPILWLAQCSK